MKPIFFISSLQHSLFFCLSQYYYKDLIVTQELQKKTSVYRKNSGACSWICQLWYKQPRPLKVSHASNMLHWFQHDTTQLPKRHYPEHPKALHILIRKTTIRTTDTAEGNSPHRITGMMPQPGCRHKAFQLPGNTSNQEQHVWEYNGKEQPQKEF